ncbi:MAG TPA: ribosome maturation factor RimP [Chlorobaculum parvum]|uniref:Ribosome maturation factor RimP n=1 Tax=Chlorobaculum parvum TaxID=274539 RepID=A0A7C5HJ22_9CHLB|nr:ribosome maturation factor RimP [Chlorobaculum parvum]
MDEMIQRAIDESIAEVSAVKGRDIYLVEADVRGGGRIIELTVEADKGVSIDQCAKLSRTIRACLEACEENLMLAGGDFELMVSSPGLGEPIRVPRQYLRHLGRKMKVVYLDSEGERKEFEGKLTEASIEGDEPSITIEPVMKGKKKKTSGREPLTLRLADIVKAVVQTEW